jgi:hypothetical protein
MVLKKSILLLGHGGTKRFLKSRAIGFGDSRYGRVFGREIEFVNGTKQYRSWRE